VGGIFARLARCVYAPSLIQYMRFLYRRIVINREQSNGVCSGGHAEQLAVIRETGRIYRLMRRGKMDHVTSGGPFSVWACVIYVTARSRCPPYLFSGEWQRSGRPYCRPRVWGPAVIPYRQALRQAAGGPMRGQQQEQEARLALPLRLRRAVNGPREQPQKWQHEVMRVRATGRT